MSDTSLSPCVWVGLCIIAEVLLGNLIPSAFQMIAGLEYAHVNLAVAALLLGVSDIHVPWETLLFSVVLSVVLPLMAGVFTRRRLESNGDGRGGAVEIPVMLSLVYVANRTQFLFKH